MKERIRTFDRVLLSCTEYCGVQSRSNKVRTPYDMHRVTLCGEHSESFDT